MFNEMFMTCSHVHNMFTTCSPHVHNIFTTCPPHFRHMFTTCSRQVHDMFTTCSRQITIYAPMDDDRPCFLCLFIFTVCGADRSSAYPLPIHTNTLSPRCLGRSKKCVELLPPSFILTSF